jgi:hypothetical protein
MPAPTTTILCFLSDMVCWIDLIRSMVMGVTHQGILSYQCLFTHATQT